MISTEQDWVVTEYLTYKLKIFSVWLFPGYVLTFKLEEIWILARTLAPKVIDKDLTRKRVSFLLIVGSTGYPLALLNYSKGGELILLCLYRVYFAVHLHLFIGLVALAPIVSTSFRWWGGWGTFLGPVGLTVSSGLVQGGTPICTHMEEKADLNADSST